MGGGGGGGGGFSLFNLELQEMEAGDGRGETPRGRGEYGLCGAGWVRVVLPDPEQTLI